MIALATGIPTPVHSSTAGQLGALAGIPFAVPRRQSEGSGPYVNLHFLFSADPGATSYNVMTSLDGNNFTIAQNIAPTVSANSFGVLVTGLLMRVDQVTKTNAVTMALTALLA